MRWYVSPASSSTSSVVPHPAPLVPVQHFRFTVGGTVVGLVQGRKGFPSRPRPGPLRPQSFPTPTRGRTQTQFSSVVASDRCSRSGTRSARRVVCRALTTTLTCDPALSRREGQGTPPQAFRRPKKEGERVISAVVKGWTGVPWSRSSGVTAEVDLLQDRRTFSEVHLRRTKGFPRTT